MKASPVMSALAGRAGMSQTLIHTGQHYDQNMSDIFFSQLGLPKPDINLEIGSGTHARQTAHIMMRLEELLLGDRPDFVLVYGDVNSTLAAAIVCCKIGIPIGHVEAGLRSFDRTMPEELNRLLTDQVADIHFTPSKDANENLEREGIDRTRIKLVGNVMIDTLIRLLPKAESLWQDLKTGYGIGDGSYGLVTIHRASNVDDADSLGSLIKALSAISSDLPLLFPVHPRTKLKLKEIAPASGGIRFIEPLGYLEFLCLQRHARLVITDSGGIQEETTFLGVPCITMRKNTERPITLELGTNHLMGDDISRLHDLVGKILAGKSRKGTIPPFWDGKAGERIADCLQNA